MIIAGSWGRSSRWNAAGLLLQEAGVGRVVEVQVDDRSGKLRSVELLNAAGQLLQEAGVGRVVEVQLDDHWGKLRSLWLVNQCPGFDSTLG